MPRYCLNMASGLQDNINELIQAHGVTAVLSAVQTWKRAQRVTPTQARAARVAKEWRAMNEYRIGELVPNCGTSLVVGEEWDTTEGFRVRQIEVRPNPMEPGHCFGTLLVVSFTGETK